MTDFSGPLRKLDSRLEQPVRYWLPLGQQRVEVSALLGQPLTLRVTGKIFCVHCGTLTPKSFNQGYCYRCFTRLAQCDGCIVAPEQCHYEHGTCREPVWADHFCMQDHIVYLANSSGLKVGITRASQVPTRWIDQGASQGLAILRTRSRQQAGFCEALLREHVADRTNWRAMLKGEQPLLDLAAERDRLLELCREGLSALQQRFGVQALSVLIGVDPLRIDYPVQSLPDRLSSLDLDAAQPLGGRLLGIRGQYLLFDAGVLNVRKYSGYECELAV
jgi:hypothetical protein